MSLTSSQACLMYRLEQRLSLVTALSKSKQLVISTMMGGLCFNEGPEYPRIDQD